MKLDPRATMLIAIGASTAANCTECLKESVNIASEMGADREHIEEAVEIGRRARESATAKLDPFALTARFHAYEISRLLSA